MEYCIRNGSNDQISTVCSRTVGENQREERADTKEEKEKEGEKKSERRRGKEEKQKKKEISNSCCRTTQLTRFCF